MAMNASFAQAAKYVVTVGGTTLTGGKSVEFRVKVHSGDLLVPTLGLDIRCAGGEGATKATLSASEEKITGSTNATFTICRVVGFEEVCEVHGMET